MMPNIERYFQSKNLLERYDPKLAEQLPMPKSLMPNKIVLDPKHKRRVIAILNELQNRGVKIPADMLNLTGAKFSFDSKGFSMKLDGKSYNPTEAQKNFIVSRARFSAFIGARGSGKSSSGAQKAIQKIAQGFNGAILNPDFENFRISTWPEFREWLPWNCVVASQLHRRNPEWQPLQPFVMAFTNGVRVLCKGLKDPDSARGPNINWLWYDEAGRDETGESWKVAVASVRVGYEPQAWITTTPKGKSHWIYKLFVEQDIPEEALVEFEKEGLGRELIEIFYGSIHDNKDNLDAGFYASMLAAYPSGWLRQQEIEGKFVDEGGAIGDRSWFDGHIVLNHPEEVTARVRFWDLAATEKKVVAGKRRNDPDETVGTLMSCNKVLDERGRTDHYEFTIEHQEAGCWLWDEIKETIKRVAIEDGFAVRQIAEQEPGSGGKNQVAELSSFLQKEIPGHPGCIGYRPEGDRLSLANIWFAEANMGRINVVQGVWNKKFFDQLDEFPGSSHTHDDRITSVSGARINLAPLRQWKNISFMKL